MPESSLEKLVAEQDFLAPLSRNTRTLFRLANTLRRLQKEGWAKRHYFQLHSEADEVESFLDDFGARYNRTFNYFTELAASVRGFALAGTSVEHLARRMPGYGVVQGWQEGRGSEAMNAVGRARAFVQGTLLRLLGALRDEGLRLGLELPDDGFPSDGFDQSLQRVALPRNLGQEVPEDEEQRIAEVVSKYLQTCTMFEDAHVRPIEDPKERKRFLQTRCTEESARVYEATVHNLQSAYDTHIKNTVLEARDERLSELRGRISAALHLLEAVTQLIHFVERHEGGQRTLAAEQRIAELVERDKVEDVALNALLFWAYRFMLDGRELAEGLLPTYTNVQSLEVEMLDGLTLHARPVSLIVRIVDHHGTPVEMEVAGQTCNAGSILEVMVAVGSKPDERCFVFRGDENPLRDIGLLFEHGLGEDGLDKLPGELSYLREG